MGAIVARMRIDKNKKKIVEHLLVTPEKVISYSRKEIGQLHDCKV